MIVKLLLVVLMMMASTNVFAQTVKERLKRAREKESQIGVERELTAAEKESIAQGLTTEYYPTGEMWKIGRYVKGKWHGRVNFYYKSGGLISSERYDKGRLLDQQGVPLEGNKLFYHENGSVRFDANYINGLIHGTLKEYNEYGELLEESIWVNGRIQREAN